MLGAFKIMIDGVWAILDIQLPLADNISFTLWQYFFFIGIMIILVKSIFNKEGSKK